MKYINQYEPVYGKEEIASATQYLKSGGWLTEFKKTKEFEQMLAEFTGAKHAIVVNNGTVSLFLALKALEVGLNDEVIVPDFTMAATPNAVILAGAKPVLVDIEQESLCLDVAQVEKAITNKTLKINKSNPISRLSRTFFLNNFQAAFKPSIAPLFLSTI